MLGLRCCKKPDGGRVADVEVSTCANQHVETLKATVCDKTNGRLKEWPSGLLSYRWVVSMTALRSCEAAPRNGKSCTKPHEQSTE